MQNPRRPLLHNMGWHFVLLDGIVKSLMSENLAEEADQRIPASLLGIKDFTSICFLSSTSNELRCRPCHSERCRAVSQWENELSFLHVFAASLRCLSVSDSIWNNAEQGPRKIFTCQVTLISRESQNQSSTLASFICPCRVWLWALGNCTGWVKGTFTTVQRSARLMMELGQEGNIVGAVGEHRNGFADFSILTPWSSGNKL